MANILEQYGIKEVADVTFYDVNTGAPVLFLDTLKVSTIEQGAEQTQSEGGKGNAPLVIWDYGKNITLTLDDALFSPRSMAITFGDANNALTTTTVVVTKMARYATGVYTGHPSSTKKYYDEDMVVTTTSANYAYIEETFANAQGHVININANTFPGVYKIVGDTYARNRQGEDKFFQFIVPLAKVDPENTITLQADGDPTVFSMTLTVLRPVTGQMMKLVQYDI